MSMFPFRRCPRASLTLFVFCLCLCLVQVLSARAADGDSPLGLDAAAKMAAARAPQVQAGQSRAEAAREDVIRAGRLPDPKLVGGIDNLTATGPHAFDASADLMTMRQIGVMQEIPARGKRDALAEVARSDAQIAGADTIGMGLAARRAAASAWVSLWAAQREHALLLELREQSTLAVKMSKARLAGGAGTASDALAVRAEVAELDNRLDVSDADISSARAALQRWLGDAADRPLDDPPDFSSLRVSPALLETHLDQQAPLLDWDAREAKADAALDLARAGKHPDWSVALSYGQRINRTDMVSLEVGVSLPIFPGNRQDRDISARYAERDAVQAEHEDARRAQREAVARSIAAWQGYGRQVQRYRDELLPLEHDRAHVALASYRGGASLQPWLDARRAEIDTRIAYADALAAWGNAWVQLAYLLPDENAAEETPR